MTNPKETPGYVDTTYLTTTADQLRRFKIMTHELMHIQAGHHVLDLGCGPASDTLMLAEKVGQTGQVVGVDYDAEMIAAARKKADDAGVSDYVIHDIHDATQLPYADGTFDSCRSERVFQHLPDPEKALKELVRVTKPGGWIVILDADWGSVVYYSSLPDIELKIKAAYQHRGALHPLIGRQLHAMMRGTGLENIAAQPVVYSGTDYQTMTYIMTLETKIKPRGLEDGYFTQDEFDRFVADLRQLDEQGNFFAYMCGIIATGQKPV